MWRRPAAGVIVSRKEAKALFEVVCQELLSAFGVLSLFGVEEGSWPYRATF